MKVTAIKPWVLCEAQCTVMCVTELRPLQSTMPSDSVADASRLQSSSSDVRQTCVNTASHTYDVESSC